MPPRPQSSSGYRGVLLIPPTYYGDRLSDTRRLKSLKLSMRPPACTTWREHFPEDVALKNQFWTEWRAKRSMRQAAKHAPAKHAPKELAQAWMGNEESSTWDDDDSRWVDLWTSSDNTSEEDEK
ncbi:hypothetical protein ZWY2020_044288 [Hordeum vulgare]|nr:hypothetical protein ZWY2020_044288 [Hordeum vulgare]